MTSRRPDDFDAERRKIVRRVSWMVWGARIAAVLLAAGGGALLAWMLTLAGLPFLRTWLNVSLLLLLVPVAVHLWPGPKPWEKDDEEKGSHG